MISQWDRIEERDGLLFCQLLHPDIEEKIPQLHLPECLKVHQNHEQQGVEWTSVMLRQWCYWPRMVQDITDWCQLCECCISAKNRPALLQILTNDSTFLEPVQEG